ncbi:AMP-dependent synthetase/ligase [Klenkia taihuensis]|uniref:Acyl-CoA synthetase n=1 Tax=Klenkia taihuensis TaxID=1225127 RepID=A0A1I1V1L1_9ACTN|nr:AMP-binding protein [Klenkia taihuensis]GHE14589.1 long-chain-fatty-acid--CoA ligase [Klenkia taihuensis]SFD76927.1 long-chain acyl-CoA synthetase [Klenkia taihuensis]
MTTTLEPSTQGTGTTTVVTRVRDRACETPTGVAMRSKEKGLWRETSWSQYWDDVLDVAHAYLDLGVQRGDRVAIQSENRREWLVADLAAVAVGAVTVGLYPTNPPAEVVHVLRDSGARVLVAEDQEQLDKALEVSAELPALEHLLYIEPRGIRGRYTDARLTSWADLLDRGRAHRAAHPGAVEQAMAQTQPGDLMTLIYTSGTTGAPKGAMLTVGNVEATIAALTGPAGLLDPPAGPKDLSLSYLPLCHVAERIFTTWNNAATGIQVNFAESIDTVPENLREIQPTFFFAVPRIWEKLLATVQVKQSAASTLKRNAGNLGLALSAKVATAMEANGGKHTAGSRLLHGIAWVLVVRALRDRLGLRRVRWAGCGAAPVSVDVLRFFMGIGVPVHEVYGMTENTASATANRPGRIRLGTVGEPHDSVELRIDEGTGEVLTRGPATFAGYWNRPDATAEAIDADGWLHTGDVGVLEDGRLRITDRMKDIMITAGGKNVAPSEIENAVKVSPLIKECVVIGDRRPYLTALIGIEPDTVGDWAQKQRIAFTTYRDLTERAEVKELVQGIVDGVNAGLNPVEQIKTFRLLPKLLDHEDGELTATQKVRRSALAERYTPLVESMYSKGARS